MQVQIFQHMYYICLQFKDLQTNVLNAFPTYHVRNCIK